jgi:hypothetical protein
MSGAFGAHAYLSALSSSKSQVISVVAIVDVDSLVTSQVMNVLWLKENMAGATARPRVSAQRASGTNFRKLGVAVRPSSALD